jgi:hypothetical protein
MPSIHRTLTPGQLAQDLAVRDFIDPTEGQHAIQLLVDAAVTALAVAWNCQVRWHPGPRVLPVEENYDRLRIPSDAVTRDVRYTRYVDRRRLLRGHATAMVLAALRTLAPTPPTTSSWSAPGWCTGATPSTESTAQRRTSSTCGASAAGRSATTTWRRWSAWSSRPSPGPTQPV